MATKRKRAPGGGRRSKGEFAGLVSPLSVRMPAKLRAQLEAAARRSGRSVSQELLSRLNISLSKDRNEAGDRATRALCFLISSMAYAVHWNMPNWRSDRFLFKAVKIGIGKLLDALPEPTGEMEPPDFRRAHVDRLFGETTVEGDPTLTQALNAMNEQIRAALQSPEAMANYAVSTTLQNYASPRPQNWEALHELASKPGLQEIGDDILRHQEDLYYGMEHAKEDLRIKGGKQ
jgi:Arc-like DNA binding domain